MVSDSVISLDVSCRAQLLFVNGLNCALDFSVLTVYSFVLLAPYCKHILNYANIRAEKHMGRILQHSLRQMSNSLDGNFSWLSRRSRLSTPAYGPTNFSGMTTDTGVLHTRKVRVQDGTVGKCLTLSSLNPEIRWDATKNIIKIERPSPAFSILLKIS